MITKLFKIIRSSYKVHSLALLLFFCVINSYAQKTLPDSNSQIKRNFKISDAQAIKLRNAFNYKGAEISKIMHDSLMKPAERQLRIKELMRERRQYLRSTLTANLLDSVKATDLANRVNAPRRVLPFTQFGKEKQRSETGIRPGLIKRDSIVRQSLKPRTKIN